MAPPPTGNARPESFCVIILVYTTILMSCSVVLGLWFQLPVNPIWELIRVKGETAWETEGLRRLIVTHVMGELGMAMYVADVSGQVMETVIPGKKKEEPARKFKSKGGVKGKQIKKKEDEDFVKPCMEEIVAVEETPGPDEIPIVEEPDDEQTQEKQL